MARRKVAKKAAKKAAKKVVKKVARKVAKKVARKAARRPAKKIVKPAIPAPRVGMITHTELASTNPAATKQWCASVLGWTFGPPMPTP